MRFSGVSVNPKGHFGRVFINCKGYGAVPCFYAYYGAVRCGFHKSIILRYGPVWFAYIANLMVRLGVSSIQQCGSLQFPVERCAVGNTVLNLLANSCW